MTYKVCQGDADCCAAKKPILKIDVGPRNEMEFLLLRTHLVRTVTKKLPLVHLLIWYIS